MIRTAVILAAGSGRRIRENLGHKPKGFITLGEKPIIRESVEKIFGAGIERIIIGIGYKCDTFKRYFAGDTGITFVENEAYDNTGSMHTLYLMKANINEDIILLESDLIYEKRALAELLEDDRSNIVLGSQMTRSTDEVFIEVDMDCYLTNMSKNPNELNNTYAELVGITKVSRKIFDRMINSYESIYRDGLEFEYEYTLAAVANRDVFVKKNENLSWCEIDNIYHLERAKKKVYPEILKREVPLNLKTKNA
jgi:2-aminoethylphosphonate-pyruvate transaminase